MLVGEVRWATMSWGAVCRLSGGRWWSVRADAALEVAPGVARDGLQVLAAWRGRAAQRAQAGAGRLAHQVHSGRGRPQQAQRAGQPWSGVSMGPAGCQQQSRQPGVRQCWRAAARSRVPAAAPGRLAAVVHCSRWRWLTPCGTGPARWRPAASGRACSSSARCHSPWPQHGAQPGRWPPGGRSGAWQVSPAGNKGPPARPSAARQRPPAPGPARPGRQARARQAPAPAAPARPAAPASGAGCPTSSSG
jgi:hypothetical protein